MKVVIFCGGLGERISSINTDLPKPMLKIGPMPILLHIILHYASFGYTEFYLLAGYKIDKIRNYFNNINKFRNLNIDSKTKILIKKINIKIINSGKYSNTGFRLKSLEKYIKKNENFFLTYGDGLSNINMNELKNYHIKKKKLLTITSVKPPARFGHIQFDDKHYVRKFNEKLQTDEGWISGGFFVCNQKIFSYLDNNKDCTFEQKPIKKLVKKKQVVTFIHKKKWFCVDNPRDYKIINEIFKKGKIFWKLF